MAEQQSSFSILKNPYSFFIGTLGQGPQLLDKYAKDKQNMLYYEGMKQATESDKEADAKWRQQVLDALGKVPVNQPNPNNMEDYFKRMLDMQAGQNTAWNNALNKIIAFYNGNGNNDDINKNNYNPLTGYRVINMLEPSDQLAKYFGVNKEDMYGKSFIDQENKVAFTFMFPNKSSNTNSGTIIEEDNSLALVKRGTATQVGSVDSSNGSYNMGGINWGSKQGGSEKNTKHTSLNFTWGSLFNNK